MRIYLIRAGFPWALFFLILFSPLVGSWGDSSTGPFGGSAHQLPAGFAALVPKGAKVSAPGFGKTAGNATVVFYASRPVKNFYVNYHFELHCFADKYWKFLEPSYRHLLQQNVDQKQKQFIARVHHDSGQGPGSEIYPPILKTYTWGYGITQRTDVHKIGEISGKVLPVVTTYECAYFGVANRSTFSLTVGEHEESLEDANQWAARCGVKAEATNLGNIGN